MAIKHTKNAQPMRLILPSLFLMLWLLTSCQQPATAIIFGQVNGKINEITLDTEPILLADDGSFTIERNTTYSTILRLNVDGQDYEVFIQPNKTVELNLTAESIAYHGALVEENEHLLSDKQLNEDLGKYLGDNWYTLHSQAQAPFLHIIDSLKGLYLSSLEQAAADPGKRLSQDFVVVNEASVNYSFDRMVLRYPEWHQRFTGEPVALSAQVQTDLETQLNAPAFLQLDTYQKFVETWLNLEAEAQLSTTYDSSIYSGRQLLDTKLAIIADQFKETNLKDFWSLAAIRTHTEQYTWINSVEYLDQFKKNCQTTSVCQQAENYEKKLIEERQGHEIKVYKTVKEQQLEVHLFYPDNFDPTRFYPTLAAFHGGGWMSGDASWVFGSANFAAKQGVIGVAVEYRLSNRSDVTPVEAMEDTRDAIRWLRKHAEEFRIDADKIVGKGISAGGHLIIAISVLPEEENSLHGAVPNSLVLVSPALDMQEDYFKGLLRSGTNPSHLSALDNLNPDLRMPPTLLLQGRTDRVTPTPYAEQFKAKMDSLEFDCRLVIYENCGHVFTPSHLDDTGTPMPDPAIVQLANEEQQLFLKKLGYIQ